MSKYVNGYFLDWSQALCHSSSNKKKLKNPTSKLHKNTANGKDDKVTCYICGEELVCVGGGACQIEETKTDGCRRSKQGQL